MGKFGVDLSFVSNSSTIVRVETIIVTDDDKLLSSKQKPGNVYIIFRGSTHRVVFLWSRLSR